MGSGAIPKNAAARQIHKSKITAVITAETASAPELETPTSRDDTSSSNLSSNDEQLSQTSNKARLSAALINARSVFGDKKEKKGEKIQKYITANKLDLLAVTETWANPTGKKDYEGLKKQCCPTGYDVHHVPRSSRGGGVAVIYNEKVVSVSLTKDHSSSDFESFELIELTLKFKQNHEEFEEITLVILYRPPNKEDRKATQFLDEEFPLLLMFHKPFEDPMFKNVLIVGDLNIHVNKKNDETASEFLDLLEQCGYKQLVPASEPTHVHGNTLDLIITFKEDNTLVSNVTIEEFELSDHKSIKFHINAPRRANQNESSDASACILEAGATINALITMKEPVIENDEQQEPVSAREVMHEDSDNEPIPGDTTKDDVFDMVRTLNYVYFIVLIK